MKEILSILVAILLFIIGYINPLIIIYGGFTLCMADYLLKKQRAFEAELYGSLEYLKLRYSNEKVSAAHVSQKDVQ